MFVGRVEVVADALFELVELVVGLLEYFYCFAAFGVELACGEVYQSGHELEVDFCLLVGSSKGQVMK